MGGVGELLLWEQRGVSGIECAWQKGRVCTHTDGYRRPFTSVDTPLDGQWWWLGSGRRGRVGGLVVPFVLSIPSCDPLGELGG